MVFDLALSLDTRFQRRIIIIISVNTVATTTVSSLSVSCVTPRVVSIGLLFRFNRSVESLLERTSLGHLDCGKKLDSGATIAAFFVCYLPFLGIFNDAGFSLSCCDGEPFWVGSFGVLIGQSFERDADKGLYGVARVITLDGSLVVGE